MADDNDLGLLDPEQAHAFLHQEVYQPIFFEKLAEDFGIRPESPQDALKMMTMASQLREAHEIDQVKTAKARGSSLDRAAQHLGNALGTSFNFNDQHNDRLVKQAADRLSADPSFATAVLTLQANAAGYDTKKLLNNDEQQQT